MSEEQLEFPVVPGKREATPLPLIIVAVSSLLRSASLSSDTDKVPSGRAPSPEAPSCPCPVGKGLIYQHELVFCVLKKNLVREIIDSISPRSCSRIPVADRVSWMIS